MKKIDVDKLKQEFKLVDGVLYKHYTKNGPHTRSQPEWRPVVNTSERGSYKNVYFDGELFLAHRIAWVLANGRDATGLIDHIDGDITNNHPDNLREVDKRGNSVNQEIHRDGKFPGMSRQKTRGTYNTSIKINKITVYLGRFSTEDEAYEVYSTAVECLESYTGDANEFRKLVYSKLGKQPPSFKGCSYKPKERKWQAMIQINKQRFSLGFYDSEETAVSVYETACKLKHEFQDKDQFKNKVRKIVETQYTGVFLVK